METGLDFTEIFGKYDENLQLPDPKLLNYYEDLQQRIIWIDDEITEELLEVVRLIVRWNAVDDAAGLPVEKRNPIKLFFFSPGGNLDVNYTVYDAIKMSRTPVIGVNCGQCASAAAYIFLGCHKRYMFDHAYFLFHQGSGAFQGSYGELANQMKDYQSQVKELSSLLIDNTKYTVDEVGEKIVTEWYVRRDEALEKGIVSKVISDFGEILR